MTLPAIGLLSVVTFLPALGALLILVLVPRRHEAALRWGGLAASVATFAASLPLWTRFDAADADMQFEETLAWMPGLGVGYHLGVDGISVMLVLLTTLLMPIALASAWHAIEERTKERFTESLRLQHGGRSYSARDETRPEGHEQGDRQRHGHDHDREGRDLRLGHDAQAVRERGPPEPARQDADGNADDQGEAGERQRLPGDNGRHLSATEPQRLENREIASPAPNGRQQDVHERRERRHGEEHR